MGSVKALFAVLRKLSFILNSKQKKMIAATFVWMIISSCLELLGVSAIYPFIQMMLDADALKQSPYVSWVYELYPNLTNIQMLLAIGIIFIVIYVVKNSVMIYSSYFQGSTSAKIQRQLSTELMKAYMKRQYEYFLNINSSEVVTNLTVDVNAMYSIISSLLQMVSEFLTILMLAIYLFMIDVQTASAAVLLMVVCFSVVTFGFRKRVKQAGKQYRESSKMMNQIAYQMINGIKDIIVTDRKECFVDMYDAKAKVKEKTAIVESLISAFPDRILEGVCIAGFMGIVCVRIALGADLVAFIPIVGSFAMGAFKILPSVAKVSTKLATIIFKMPSLNNCYKNFAEIRKDSSEYGENSYAIDDSADTGDYRFENKITVEEINWHYKNVPTNVLEGLSIEIHKGESIAFIGSSGAGKTTLADVVLGLLKPQKGGVFMDGVDVSTIPHSFSKVIGYVPQSVFLIDDTIRANVAFGIPEEELTDDKVWHALEQAQLKNFVETLPQGLDTIVGERGVKLSGGQRQRVAIARAMYVDPEVLVLDEATSALDNETETAVMESIDALQGHKTLIIVAHRLSTIRNCDTIYEIGDGIATKRTKKEVFGE